MVIDAHLHVQPWSMFTPEARARMAEGRQDIDTIREIFDDPAALLRFLDREGVDRAVLVNYVSPDIIGFGDEINEWVGTYCKGHEDRLIAMGGVHPRLSRDPVGDLERIVEKHGIRALKIHPPHQLIHPNAYRDGGARPGLSRVYEKAQELHLPILFHTGTSVFPRARNRYGDPMDLDDVAVDFPNLTIVMAHGGRPLWMETCFFLLRRHPNVYMDISGIPPKSLLTYFPRLVEVADKTMFGTDWPGPGVPGVGSNVREFQSLPLPDDAREAILWRTAAKVYGGAAATAP